MAAQYSMIDIHNILRFYLPSNGYSSLLSCINYCCVTNYPKFIGLKPEPVIVSPRPMGSLYGFTEIGGLTQACGHLWISWELIGLGRSQLGQLSPPSFFFLVIMFLLHFLWCWTGISCDTYWHPCFIPHLEGSISEV